MREQGKETHSDWFEAFRFLAWGVFVLGVLYRYVFTFSVAPPQNHLINDPGDYLKRAINLCQQTFPWDITHTMFPPGTDYFYGAVYCIRKNQMDLSWAIVIGSSLIPVLIYSLARTIYGHAVGLLSLILASTYFPFINFGGFYLSEIPVMLTMLMGTICLIEAFRSSSERKTWIFWALCVGFFSGLSATIKLQALAPLLLTAALGPFFQKTARGHTLKVIFVSLLGTIPVLIPGAVRCTTLNGGNLCLGAKSFGINLLVGHQPGKPWLRFLVKERNLELLFSGPFMDFEPERQPRTLEFGPWEDEKIKAEIAKEFGESPGEFLFTFWRNTKSYFGAVQLWPQSEAPLWAYELFRYFLWFMFAILFLAYALIPRWFREECQRLEFWQLVLPMLGGFLCGIIGTGEPRYRVPFDCYLIILFAAAVFQLFLIFFPQRSSQVESLR